METVKWLLMARNLRLWGGIKRWRTGYFYNNRTILHGTVMVNIYVSSLTRIYLSLIISLRNFPSTDPHSAFWL
jgi:hypothetical protein